MNAEEKKPSFWETLPGIITAVGTLLGACAALIIALYTAGIIGSGEKSGESNVVTESNVDMTWMPLASGLPPGLPSNRPKAVVSSKVDRTNAKATAGAVLSAYRARDVIALAGLVNETNRGIFVELAGKGESHPRYNSVFSDWRWESVQAWNGQMGEARYRHYVGTARDEYQAHIKFGQLGPDELLVVTLTWEGGKWCFEDIHSPTHKSFYSGALSLKLGPEPY